MFEGYESPRVAVDIVIFGYDAKQVKRELSLLLVERVLEPFLGQWALPGGFVHIDETLEQAARRELREEAGLEDVYLEQLYTFGSVERDPRARVVSVSYFALVASHHFQPRAGTDARQARWFSMQDLPPLAFDHRQIVLLARERIRSKIRYEPIGFELLPKQFTLTEIQNLYEAVTEEAMDKRNFRKKILSFGVLKLLKTKVKNVSHRFPALYSFDPVKYRALLKRGHKYEI